VSAADPLADFDREDIERARALASELQDPLALLALPHEELYQLAVHSELALSRLLSILDRRADL
jgi:two-component sensor histidine kinase